MIQVEHPLSHLFHAMLKKLQIKNFRNHAKLSMDIPENGLIITGVNGSGKTSILEAIYTLATLKPFRCKNTYLCMKNGEAISEVSAVTDFENILIRWQSSPKKKTSLFRNSVLYSSPEFLKKKSFFAVLFSPEDLLLPYGSPDQRRRYMNRVLIPLFEQHFQAMRSFEKILKSRNALLKRIAEGIAKQDELDFYDTEFSRESEKITKKRSEFFLNIKNEVSQKYAEISGSSDELVLCFHPNAEKNVLSLLQQCRKKDIQRSATTCGAHLDDFSFSLRGIPIQENGSRGEVRSAILSLKMAENRFVESITNKKPVLLLDDVYSELDADHRKHLMTMITGAQTLITTTDVPSRAVQKVSMEIFKLLPKP